MRVGDLVHGRLSLLCNLHEQRQCNLRIKQRFSETLWTFKDGITRIEPCTPRRGGDRLNPETGSTCHGCDLGLGEAWQWLDACHLPDEFAQDDNLRSLARVELVHDIFE